MSVNPNEAHPKQEDVVTLQPKNNIASSAVVGFGVGMLVGLSASPIVGNLISGVLAMVAAALAIIVGWKRPEFGHVQMVPLAWFTSLLVVGALLGIMVRAHSLLAPGILLGMDSKQSQVASWVALGIERDQAVKAIFAKEFPLSTDVRALRMTEPMVEMQKWASTPVSTTQLVETLVRFSYPESGEPSNQVEKIVIPTEPKTDEPVLWSSRASACDDLLNELDGSNIRDALARSIVTRWQVLVAIDNTETLKSLISEDLCPSNGKSWPWE